MGKPGKRFHLTMPGIDIKIEDAGSFADLMAKLGALVPLFSQGKAQPAAADQAPELTDRERQIGRLILEGLNNDEIALQLVIAYSTVRNHRASLYKKFNVHRKSELKPFRHLFFDDAEN